MATLAPPKPISNIAVAFAAESASFPPSAVPIPCEGGNPAAPGHRGMLPTPPNSISPTLQAHKHRPGQARPSTPHPPSQVDSDIDLQDAVEHAAAQDLPSAALSREALAGVEAAGQITAAMLAKYHLPTIFLGHGSMPVRDIMSHLAQSVPGYSRIPPAKARRLVVAALEYRAGGGLHGEVVFEKVGWGRWHVKGQKGQTEQGVPIGLKGATGNGLTPPASVDSTRGYNALFRNKPEGYSGSWAAGSLRSSPDEEMADRMSLDGSETDSEASNMDLENDLMDDDTDEEDWSAIGPDALRKHIRAHHTEYRDYNYLSRMTGVRYRSTSAQSVPLSRAGRNTPAFNKPLATHVPASRGNKAAGTLTASSGVLGNTSEREAVEALLSMGSM